MKYLLLFLVPVSMYFNNVLGNAFCVEHHVPAADSNNSYENRLAAQTEKCRRFIRQNHQYNQQYIFLVDMRIPSCRYRFFVVDVTTGKIIYKGLVAHGVYSNAGADGVMTFSNEKNSYCSSLGKFCIGASYTGRFGKSYRLTGLDASNSQAFKRVIVLHKYECVPLYEQNQPICNSLGCPMVSPAFFSQLEKLIDQSAQKILLCIYY